MAWTKYKLDRLVTDRPPGEQSSLPWLQREVVPFLKTARQVLNWAIDYLGLAQVITGDTPGTLNAKLTVSGGLTKSVVTAGDGTSTLNLDGAGTGSYDPALYRPNLLGSGETIWSVGFSRACTIPANFAGGKCILLVAPLTGLTVTVKYTPWGGVATTLGTIVFAAGATTVSTITTSAQAAAAGSMLTFHNQAIADAQAAGLIFWAPIARA